MKDCTEYIYTKALFSYQQLIHLFSDAPDMDPRKKLCRQHEESNSLCNEAFESIETDVHHLTAATLKSLKDGRCTT